MRNGGSASSPSSSARVTRTRSAGGSRTVCDHPRPPTRSSSGTNYPRPRPESFCVAPSSPNWRTPMPDAVIVSALRTPIGTAGKGTLRDTDAFTLAHHIVEATTADLDTSLIDDVILGEGLYGGGVIARHAAITTGLTHVPGLAHNRHCAASLASVQ